MNILLSGTGARTLLPSSQIGIGSRDAVRLGPFVKNCTYLSM